MNIIDDEFKKKIIVRSRYIFAVFVILFVLSLILFVGCEKNTDETDETKTTRLRLATATSTKDSGLLNYLLPVFEKENNVKVDVLALGTGQALEIAAMGDADVVLVHSKEAEEEFIARGDGIKRFEVMYNDFVVVGPKDDSAQIRDKSISEAFTIFSKGDYPFISRGDDSGTHKKELSLWEELMMEPKGKWYLSIGKGMGDTLITANELQGYALTDRGTYLSMKDKLELEILIEGDKDLLNTYGIIAVNPDKHPEVNYEEAQKLIDFLLSAKGQQMINDYRVNGYQLFYPINLPEQN